MMGIACAIFHWAPQTFWEATPHEFWAAVEAHRDANSPTDDDALTKGF